MDCIFCKIVNNEINSYTIYEDEIVKVFLDVNPNHIGHTLIVPKKHYQDFFDIDEEALHHILKVAKEIAALLKERLNYDGISLCENNGLGQEVKHFHLHLIPKYNNEEKLSLEEMHKAVLNAKVVLVGSPTINKTMVKPMWDLFSSIDPMANKGTIAGVFGSYGWSGEGISMAENLFKAMSFKLPQPALKKKFFPSDDTFKECFDYGVEFAQYIK